MDIRFAGPHRARVCFLLLAASFAIHDGALAQKFPARPIRLIAASSPSSAVDIVSRIVGQKLSDMLGQQIVVDNRAGAGGNLGAEVAAHATPDGYTWFMATPAHVIDSSWDRKPRYHLLRDFSPVTQVTTGMYVLIVNPRVPAKSVRDLIALAKAHPGKLNFGSGGVGNATHLAVALFDSMAGIRMTHVPYRGSGPALVALLGDQVQLMIANVTAALRHVRAGKVRALAVTGAKRSPLMPDTPTIAEAGVPGYQVTSWFGIVVPRGVPQKLIATLAGDVATALRDPTVAQRLSSGGAEPVGSSPRAFHAFLESETMKWRKVIQQIRSAPAQ